MTTCVIDFDTRVALTVHSAYLAAAGIMLTDPVVHVTEVQTYTTATPPSANNNNAGVGSAGVTTTCTTRRLASTERKVFTAHPVFEETLRVVVPHERRAAAAAGAVHQRYLVLDVEGPDGAFLGQAVCPFSLAAPSRGNSRRLMLQPRHTTDAGDCFFRTDLQTLHDLQLDDFGHIVVSFDLTLAPHGGVALPPPTAPSVAPLPFPLGCVVQATWLSNASSAAALGNHFSTFVELSPSQRFCADGGVPVYATLDGPCGSVGFVCTTQKGLHGAPQACRVSVPLQPCTPPFVDRDVHWCLPVHAPDSTDSWGVLMVRLRLLSKPVDEGVVRAQQAASAQAEWGRPSPDTPPNALGLPSVWEGDAHVARSAERRWRRDCVTEARPAREHVRHVFEATLRRVSLDAAVAPLVGAFYNRAAESVTPAEMRELLVAMAFGAMPLPEALRFAFACMRTKVPNGILPADAAFILEHCLVPRTLDMPAAEIARRAADLLGLHGEGYISYATFDELLVRNAALWYELGVPVEHGTEVRAQSSKGPRPGASVGPGGASAGGASHISNPQGPPATQAPAAGTGTGAGSGDGNVWRTFTVRVIKTGRAFNVTAHVTDIVADVMAMVEGSTTVAAYRQAWVYEGIPIDPRRAIGAVIPQVPTGDVSIGERDEAVLLVLVHREKNRRWEHRVPVGDKVLKLRAHVQQKTMIPLSRCVLRYAGTVMWDRHTLEHYKLSDGAIIEISVE